MPVKGILKRNRDYLQPCVGVLVYTTENPYQILLKNELNLLGFRVVCNPPLNLLRILLKRDGLDALHIHWPHFYYRKSLVKFLHLVCALLLYRVMKNNIVWTAHELNFHDTKNNMLNYFMPILLCKISRTIIVHTKECKKELESKRRLKGNIALFSIPSFGAYYHNVIDRKSARKMLNIQDESFVYLYFGYIKPYKGVEELIEIFKTLKDLDIVLLVVGNIIDDQLKAHIVDLSRDDPRIRLDLRYISDEEIQTYFNASDIVVFPFNKIETSSSILLPFSFGRPIIIPALGSLLEYVNRDIAIIYDPSEPGGLEGALVKARTCDLEKMGSAAYEYAKNSFTWREFAIKHKEVYDELLAK